MEWEQEAEAKAIECKMIREGRQQQLHARIEQEKQQQCAIHAQ